jgi:hypothetical protein
MMALSPFSCTAALIWIKLAQMRECDGGLIRIIAWTV